MKKSKRKNQTIYDPIGSVVHSGDIQQENAHLDVFQYSHETFIRADSIPESMENSSDLFWLNLKGVGSVNQITELAKLTNAHNLQVEDILNFDHRPKVEEINETILYIFKQIELNERLEIETVQISILLNKNVLVSFQERSRDTFSHIYDALNNSESNLRKQTIDYLFYRLIDSVVRSYFEVIDRLEDSLEDLEDRIITDDQRVELSDVICIKKATYLIRKLLRPMREANLDLIKSNQLNQGGTDLFFKDVNDQITHLIEQCDGILDSATNLISIFHSNSGNRLNEIMKRLTVVSTIFIPLSFLAGFYGMNFKFMPELNQEYAYPILIGAMLLTALSIYIYMKRSRWF